VRDRLEDRPGEAEDDDGRPEDRDHDRVRREAGEGHLSEVERRQRCRPEKRARRRQERVAPAGPPALAGPDAARAPRDGGDRNEGELRARVERRGREDEREPQRGDRERAQRVDRASGDLAGRRGDDHHRRAQDREPEPREHRVQRDRHERDGRGQRADGGREQEPLAAAEDAVREAERRRGDERDVEPRYREDVYHAGARERLAELRPDAALLAQHERLQQGAARPCDRGRDQARHARAPALETEAEPAAHGRKAADRGRLPDRCRHMHAAPREEPGPVESPRVLEVPRQAERRRHAQAVAVLPAPARPPHGQPHEALRRPERAGLRHLLRLDEEDRLPPPALRRRGDARDERRVCG
jgi:hypothetical protein